MEEVMIVILCLICILMMAVVVRGVYDIGVLDGKRDALNLLSQKTTSPIIDEIALDVSEDDLERLKIKKAIWLFMIEILDRF